MMSILKLSLICIVFSLTCCKEHSLMEVNSQQKSFYTLHCSCLNEMAASIFEMNLKGNRDFSEQEFYSILSSCDSCENSAHTALFKRPCRYFKNSNREFILFYPNIDDVQCTFSSLLVYKNPQEVDKESIFLDNQNRWKVNLETASPCF